jgi:Holliday junction resolvase-like predicted endonuclease
MLEMMTALGYQGWRVFRCPPSIYAHKGWPDFVAVKYGITVFVEVKAEKGKQNKDQSAFQRDVESGGAIYLLARSYEDVEAALKGLQIQVPDSQGKPAMAITPVKGMRCAI